MKTVLLTSNIRRTLLSVLFTVAAVFTEPDSAVYGQGLFNNNPSASSREKEEGVRGIGINNNGSENDGGSGLRAGGRENEDDTGRASKLPVKDGWAVLLIGGIGYGIYIAKRKKR